MEAASADTLGPFGGRLAVKVADVARALDVSRSQVYELLKQGHLRKITIGDPSGRAGVRVCVRSVLEFIERGGCERAAGPTVGELAAQARQRVGSSGRYL